MYEIIGAIFVLHWFGDFFCQSDWMAKNKSDYPPALLLHVFVYSCIMYLGLILINNKGTEGANAIFNFVKMNCFFHFFTDFITSRINSYLWEKKKVHWFFVSIGFDQLLHQIILLATAKVYLS
jgi:hypothetical protein